MIQIPADFLDFLKLLESHEVEYLLVGGYAVGIHGYPRPTGDIDIWVAMKTSNAEKIMCVLTDFGYDIPSLQADLFLKEESLVRLGVPPRRLEILTAIDGVDFESAYQNRRRILIGEVEINVIDLETLLKNKRASGRPKDLVDVDMLEQN